MTSCNVPEERIALPGDANTNCKGDDIKWDIKRKRNQQEDGILCAASW